MRKRWMVAAVAATVAGLLALGPTALAGKKTLWFGGLDENRIEWAEGRDFDLEPRSQVRPDLVIRGWIEVDGKPHKGIERVLNFHREEQLASDKAKLPVAQAALR